MKIKNLLSIVLVFCVVGFATAQDDLLNQLDAGAPKQDNIEIAAFKASLEALTRCSYLPDRSTVVALSPMQPLI